jgi:thioredoxin reductase (NADPH)
MADNVVIIGSGPAGFTAAIYTARANLKPVLFEGFLKGGMPGGQLMTTGVVENFPGFPEGIDGQGLMANMRKQAEVHGAALIMEDVAEVNLAGRPFEVVSAGGERRQANTVIVATGAGARRLTIPSEKKFWTKGISACAVCDGGLPVFRNQALAVLGGGDAAVEEATHLTQFASKVYLIHRRDQLRASQVMQRRVMNHAKIEVLWNKTVEEFLGGETLSGLRLKDTATGEESTIEVRGCFEAIGHEPNTSFLNGQLALDEMGYIITRDRTTATSVPGVFAAGDVQDRRYRQAISAAGSGCQAALDAERWLQEEGLI